MAENPCDGTLNGTSNTSNLLSHPSNTIESINPQSSGLGLLSDISFIHHQNSTSQNSTTTNVISLINSATTALILGELNRQSTLNATTNSIQQSDYFNTIGEAQLSQHSNAERGVEFSSTSTSTTLLDAETAPATEVALNNNRSAPSPLTMSSDLTRGSNRGEENVSEGSITITRTQLEVTEQGTYLSVPVSNDIRSLSCFDEEAFDEGYDSDGQLGPFFDAVADECPFEDYEEETPGQVSTPQASVAELQPEPEETYTPLSEIAITSMTVKDLRNELKKRKQPVSAKRKEELVQRLLAVAHLPPSPVDDSPAMAVEENNQPNNCFHHEANWHLLELDTANPIRDPNNVPGLVAPTTHAVAGTAEPVKYNFTDSFDRDPFVALAKEYQLDRNGNVKKDRDQNPIMVDNVKKKADLP